MKFEVCANSFESAMNAEEGGADRIELCSELALGGLTPSYGLLKEVMQKINIPVRVLIRPRSGNFTYSSAEFSAMKNDIKLAKSLGCEGVVSGVLMADNRLDLLRTSELVELAKPMHFVFHRAFDWVVNPGDVLHQLKSIGVETILSSGQQANAELGFEMLKEMKLITKDKMTILPGGGINVGNAAKFKNAGFSEIHASASIIKRESVKGPLPMNSLGVDDRDITISDLEKIKAIIEVIS